MPSALDKVMLAAGWGSQLEDSSSELALAALTAVQEIPLLLAQADDASGDDEETDGDQDDDHSGHATFKALSKKGMPPKRAAKMCAQADKKVKATALANSLHVILSGMFERDGMVFLAAPAGESASDRKALAKKGWALDDGSYPIPDARHLHKAAVLAASKHGNWQAAKSLIRKRANDLGVDVNSLPGFGGDSAEDKKVAATMVMLAASSGQMKGMAEAAHPPFHGVHSHAHVHAGDNMHGPVSDRAASRNGSDW